jgi:hypothetical protein
MIVIPYPVKLLQTLDKPYVLETVLLKKAFFQKPTHLNLLPDLVTNGLSLYTKPECNCIQTWGEKLLLTARAFRVFTWRESNLQSIE